MLDLEGLVLVKRSGGGKPETVVPQLTPVELAEHCQRLGAAAPLVGRFIAEQIDREKTSPAWAVIGQLAQAVAAATAPSSVSELADEEEDVIPF